MRDTGTVLPTARETVQTLLARAKQLLDEVGKICDEEGLEPEFMGMKYHMFNGWIPEVEDANQWRGSDCEF